jgi:hypothetical protein
MLKVKPIALLPKLTPKLVFKNYVHKVTNFHVESLLAK